MILPSVQLTQTRTQPIFRNSEPLNASLLGWLQLAQERLIVLMSGMRWVQLTSKGISSGRRKAKSLMIRKDR